MKKYGLAIGLVFMITTSQASLWSWLGFGQTDKPSEHQQNNHELINEHDGHDHHLPVVQRQIGTQADYEYWLSTRPYDAQKAYEYEQYLRLHLGVIPPMHELLTTARSWQACGYEPYEVPPQSLWANMVPTLRLYQHLKAQKILPVSTQIRSVYRNLELNRCAGGAVSSKHVVNGAIDIWVPEYGDESQALFDLKDKLCQFWQQQGARYQFGLGLYATGAIHLDTQGYRKWGVQYSRESSPCQEALLYQDGQ